MRTCTRIGSFALWLPIRLQAWLWVLLSGIACIVWPGGMPRGGIGAGTLPSSWGQPGAWPALTTLYLIYGNLTGVSS